MNTLANPLTTVLGAPERLPKVADIISLIKWCVLSSEIQLFLYTSMRCSNIFYDIRNMTCSNCVYFVHLR
jgi:hypothetical protein